MIPSEIKKPNSKNNLKQKYKNVNQIDGVRNLVDLTFVGCLRKYYIYIHTDTLSYACITNPH